MHWRGQGGFSPPSPPSPYMPRRGSSARSASAQPGAPYAVRHAASRRAAPPPGRGAVIAHGLSRILGPLATPRTCYCARASQGFAAHLCYCARASRGQRAHASSPRSAPSPGRGAVIAHGLSRIQGRWRRRAPVIVRARRRAAPRTCVIVRAHHEANVPTQRLTASPHLQADGWLFLRAFQRVRCPLPGSAPAPRTRPGARAPRDHRARAVSHRLAPPPEPYSRAVVAESRRGKRFAALDKKIVAPRVAHHLCP